MNVVVLVKNGTGRVVCFGPFRSYQEANEHCVAVPLDMKQVEFHPLVAPGDLFSMPRRT